MENKSVKRVFISGINTQLGFYLTETLRQDHIKLQGYALISGTLTSQQQQYQLHDSVHQTFDFNKNRDIAVKKAIQSDFIIFDIRFTPSYEIQFILKVLKHYKLKKPLTVIGISNYMTWSNSKVTQFVYVPNDKDSLLQHTLNKQHWKKVTLNPQHYLIRVPHPMFVYNHQLQQQILELHYSNELINSQILCAGVLYGRSGFDLQQYIISAIQNNKIVNPLLVHHRKLIQQNLQLPFLHIDKLLQVIFDITNQCSNKYANYLVLCQKQFSSVSKIIQEIYQKCGNISLKEKINRQSIVYHPLNNENSRNSHCEQNTNLQVPNNCLTPVKAPSLSQLSSQRLYSLTNACLNPSNNTFIPQIECKGDKKLFSLLGNVRLKRSTEFDNMSSQNQINVEKRINKLVQQFLHCYDLEFKHFLLCEQLIDSQSFEKYRQKILNTYLVINKAFLNTILQDLIQKGVINYQRVLTPEQQKKKHHKKPQSREQSKKQQYQIHLDEIFKEIISKRHHSNYIICLKHQILEKVLHLLNNSSFGQFNKTNFINIVQNANYVSKDPIHHKVQLVSDYIEKNVQICSDQFYSLFGIEIVNQNNNLEQNCNKDNVKTQKKENSVEKNLKHAHSVEQESQKVKINLISQYLLDNVIVYAAQAKQKLKQKQKQKNGQKIEGKQNLRLFVQELKKIRERQAKICSQEYEGRYC